MNKILNLLNYSMLLDNFQNCINWDERYLYIIELGSYLPTIPKKQTFKKHFIPGCQSKVWIIMKVINLINNKNIIKFYGDSDSAITKGILCIIFVIYKELTLKELIDFDPYPFLNKLELTKHLTYSRSQGIASILETIKKEAEKINNTMYKKQNGAH